MNEVSIFKNIKKYIATFDTELLDLLLVIDNPNSRNPEKRYKDFARQFNAHFGYWALWNEKVGMELPSLAVQFTPLDTDSGCFQKYQICFIVRFTTVPLNRDTDGDTRMYTVNSSPEQILEYKERFDLALHDIMDGIDVDSEGHIERYNAFSKLKNKRLNGKLWAYPLDVTVLSESTSDLVSYNEILQFSHCFTVMVENPDCKTHGVPLCKNC